MMNNLVWVKKHGQMDLPTREPTKILRRMVKVFSLGLMVLNMKVTSSITNSVEAVK